jgi:hypothetical protein
MFPACFCRGGWRLDSGSIRRLSNDGSTIISADGNFCCWFLVCLLGFFSRAVTLYTDIRSLVRDGLYQVFRRILGKWSDEYLQMKLAVKTRSELGTISRRQPSRRQREEMVVQIVQRKAPGETRCTTRRLQYTTAPWNITQDEENVDPFRCCLTAGLGLVSSISRRFHGTGPAR